MFYIYTKFEMVHKKVLMSLSQAYSNLNGLIRDPDLYILLQNLYQA